MWLDPVRHGGAQPALCFLPPGAEGGLPLVLLGHGAHLSKDDPVMQILGKTLCRGIPAAVALMDCPGHGERRAADVTDEMFEADINRRLSDAATYAQVRDDWVAVEGAARASLRRIAGATGYAGFSMGADLPTVVTAVFALGGLTVEERRNVLIRDGARRLGDREVLMLNMNHDEYFAMDGALEVFDLIPGPKRMGVWPGSHVDIPPE